MKKILAVILSSLFVIISSSALAKKGGPAGTVEILHKPDDQAIIITISVNALEAHIAHGDCVYGEGDDDEGPSRSIDIDDYPNCADDDGDDNEE